jgi:hypothetical protein
MRAQVTISHIVLGTKMLVEVIDGHAGTYKSYAIENEDAEYQLLAQAIDRFVAVQKAKKKPDHDINEESVEDWSMA